MGDIESRYKTLQDLLAARRDIYNAEVKRQEDNEAKVLFSLLDKH